MPITLDGIPANDTVSFLSDIPNPLHNAWSYGKQTKIIIMDFWINPKNITWKGKTIRVEDYHFFTMVIAQWMSGTHSPLAEPMTKEAALDLFFEMEA